MGPVNELQGSRLKSLVYEKRFPLIVSLAANDPELARAAQEAGADAVKLHLNTVHEITGSRFGSWEEEREGILAVLAAVDLPVGVVPGQGDAMADERAFEEMAAAGVDFIDAPWFALPGAALRRSLQEGRPAVMAALSHADLVATAGLVADPANAGPAPNHVRALPVHHVPPLLPSVTRLPGIDLVEAAVAAPGEVGRPLTAATLVRYAQVCQDSRLPVIVPSQLVFSPQDLRVLAAVGVAGVLLGPLVIGRTVSEIGRQLPRFRQVRDSL